MSSLHLQYSESGNEENLSNVFQYSNNQEMHYELIKETMFERFCKKEYAKLEQDLFQNEWNKAQMAEFFFKKGEPILNWSIVNAIDNEPLKFLLNNIPMPILKKMLSNNSYILRSFLLSEKNHEQCGWADEKNRDIQIERFSILLKIDEQGVCAFMRESNIVTNRIKKNFMIAVKDPNRLLCQPKNIYGTSS